MITKLSDPRFLLFLATATILTILMPMAFTLGGLAGIMLAPSASLTTMPISLQLLAGLLAVTPISLLMGRNGRRVGFMIGASATFLGGIIGVAAIIGKSFILLCGAHLLFGASIVTFALFRFAASEIVTPAKQATAISFALGTSLLAVIVAPYLFDATYAAFSPPNLNFAGAYAAVSVVALVGGLLLTITHFAPPARTSPSPTVARRPGVLKAISSLPRIASERPRVACAILAGAATYAAMMGIMTAAPVAIVECGFTEGAAGTVISYHMIAMFAPSFFTGPLIARIGAPRVLILALALFIAAVLFAATGIQLWNFHASLILLGIGWNFGYIGATTMLNAELQADEKPLFQGVNDAVVMLFSTISAFLSGIILTSFGWAIVAIATVPIALLLLSPRFIRREAPSAAI